MNPFPEPNLADIFLHEFIPHHDAMFQVILLQFLSNEKFGTPNLITYLINKLDQCGQLRQVITLWGGSLVTFPTYFVPLNILGTIIVIVVCNTYIKVFVFVMMP